MTDSYRFKSPIGMLHICEENGAITGLYLQGSVQSSDLHRPGILLTGDTEGYGVDFQVLTKFTPHSDLLYEACKQIEEYFAGHRMKFELPLQLNGTTFRQQVWHALQEIPYGEVRSYEDIAIRIGKKKAVRAVGQANHYNPILIIVPCHRVIAKNGGLGGFGCGLDTKKYLLALEGYHTKA